MSNQDNALRFSLALERFGKRVPQMALAIAQKVGLDVLAGVVRKSPVDTGRFRANWQVSESGDASPTARVDKSKYGSDPDSATKALAEATIATLVPFSKFYITNPLPYGPRLERGWSQQAPAGMVSLTLAEVASGIEARLRR